MSRDGKRRGVGRALLRLVGWIVKAVAVALAFCVCCCAVLGCVLVGNLLTDAVRERGGDRYVEFKDSVERLGRELTDDEATPEQQRAYLRAQLNAMADAQASVDEQLLAELDSGAYTLEAPFVLVNPYGIAPLSAVVLFQTEEPARISIHVAGDTPQAEVDFDFSEYDTRHMIPVYGLYAGRENAVTITATDREGATQTAQIAVATDVLPVALTDSSVRAHALDASACQPGFTFTYRGVRLACKSAFDINGDYRWYLDTEQSGSILRHAGYCGDYNGGKSLFITCGNMYYGPSAVMEFNFLGKLLNAWYSPYGVHHDIEPDDTGVLVTGCDRDDASYEALVFHIDAQSGEIDRKLDYSDFMQTLRDQTEGWGASDYYTSLDWLHMNTVLSYQGDLITSNRNQSTVMRNDWEGNIKWMLCDPTGYYDYYKQYILTPVGENFEYFYCQHAPELLRDQDGNPDTLDILLFDNGDFRPEESQRRSRLMQYRINEREMTVELIWSWGGDRPWLYSAIHGDADLLPNGNRLGSFEPSDLQAGTNHAYGVELDALGNVVWEVWRTSNDLDVPYHEYRLDRLNIYAETANDLRLGERAGLFLPEN